jgi:hypothetical protein
MLMCKPSLTTKDIFGHRQAHTGRTDFLRL